MNSRYYAAGIGRFLTKDTFKGIATDSQSLNRYAYTEGDPINLADPTGHDVGFPGVDGATGIPYDQNGNDAPNNTHWEDTQPTSSARKTKKIQIIRSVSIGVGVGKGAWLELSDN